jgi:NAD(P)-dependent dehydrogenase (short-subunit alcohol dehydrogenase family)
MKRSSQVIFAASAVVCVLGIASLVRRQTHDPRPKMVLVTGCANGLGRATVETLVSKGDFVVGADIDEKGLQAIAKAFPTTFFPLVMDVSSPESVKRAATELLSFAGKPCLDAIVNNAGLNRGGSLIELSDEDLALVMKVNVIGTMLVTKHFFPLLLRKTKAIYRPRVINFGSEVSYAQVSAMFILSSARSQCHRRPCACCHHQSRCSRYRANKDLPI